MRNVCVCVCVCSCVLFMVFIHAWMFVCLHVCMFAARLAHCLQLGQCLGLSIMILLVPRVADAWSHVPDSCCLLSLLLCRTLRWVYSSFHHHFGTHDFALGTECMAVNDVLWGKRDLCYLYHYLLVRLRTDLLSNHHMHWVMRTGRRKEPSALISVKVQS